MADKAEKNKLGGRTPDYGTQTPPNRLNVARLSREGNNPRVMFDSAPEPEGKALYTRELDRLQIIKARKLLYTGALIAGCFSAIVFIGGVLSYAMCLIINSTAYMVIFSRVMFLAFLLESSGRPASRLVTYRGFKRELYYVLISLLVAWFIMGGALFLSVVHAVNSDFGIVSLTLFLITSFLGCIFSIVVLVLMGYGRKLADPAELPPLTPRGTPTRHGYSPMDSPGSPGHSITAGLATYARERGLLLRRTLKHLPMRPYLAMTIWFMIQSVLAFVAALVILLLPQATVIDLILAFLFAPLTFIGSLFLSRDLVDVLMEGILQGLDFSEVAEALLNIDGVVGVRQLRIWALTMDRVSLSVLLSIDGSADVDWVLNEASALLKAKYDVFEYQIDMERDKFTTRRARLLEPS